MFRFFRFRFPAFASRIKSIAPNIPLRNTISILFPFYTIHKDRYHAIIHEDIQQFNEEKKARDEEKKELEQLKKEQALIVETHLKHAQILLERVTNLRDEYQKQKNSKMNPDFNYDTRISLLNDFISAIDLYLQRKTHCDEGGLLFIPYGTIQYAKKLGFVGLEYHVNLNFAPTMDRQSMIYVIETLN
jgi:hypothetical protein